MADPLLSSLCRVCNINPTRYRCPRCNSQTCSLHCVKRHKLWAHCNGIRDPTVYKRRRDILTPAGIDHDFNFISSIERRIERSDRVIEERGLVNREDLLGAKKKYQKCSKKNYPTMLSKMLVKSGVWIHRAPKVMTRSKENGTYWRKGLHWQVEWIDEDGNRSLSTISENDSLEERYTTLLREHHLSKMTAVERKEHKNKRRAAMRARLPTEQSQALLQKIPTSLDAESAAKYHFYLHKPNASSSHRILIPIDAQAPFGPQLRHRDVVEFPTIHVLSCPPEQLPDKFMLEEQQSRAERGSKKTLADQVDEEINMDTREEGEVSEDDNEDDESDEGMDAEEGENCADVIYSNRKV